MIPRIKTGLVLVGAMLLLFASVGAANAQRQGGGRFGGRMGMTGGWGGGLMLRPHPSMQGVDFRNMSPEDRQQIRQKMEAFRKTYADKYVALLTSSQKTHWKQMLGEPFKLILPPPGQGGPGGPSA